MAKQKRKFEANAHLLQEAALVTRKVHGKDLADLQPIGYLSSLDTEQINPLCTRDMVLRLIATLKAR